MAELHGARRSDAVSLNAADHVGRYSVFYDGSLYHVHQALGMGDNTNNVKVVLEVTAGGETDTGQGNLRIADTLPTLNVTGNASVGSRGQMATRIPAEDATVAAIIGPSIHGSGKPTQ